MQVSQKLSAHYEDRERERGHMHSMNISSAKLWLVKQKPRQPAA